MEPLAEMPVKGQWKEKQQRLETETKEQEAVVGSSLDSKGSWADSVGRGMNATAEGWAVSC